MQRRAYDLYVGTFRRARAGLASGDELALRAMCAEVAGRSGIESSLALLAISDAERGLAERDRATVFRTFWAGVLDERDAA